jgi:hypothetical protein
VTAPESSKHGWICEARGLRVPDTDEQRARRQASKPLALRANPNTLVGYDEVPLALLPLMEGNPEAIRLLRDHGVDYSKLRYKGATAFDFATQTGNKELLRALGPGETML